MNSIGKAIGTALAGATILSAAASADPLTMGYVGHRSADPEKETYAYLEWTTESVHLLGFVGPARYVGPVTGNVEKDTIAYRPVLAVPNAGLWSCPRAQ